MAALQIKVTSQQLTKLLDGEPVQVLHRGAKLPRYGEGIEVTLHEPQGVQVVIEQAELVPPRGRRRKRTRRHVETWWLRVKRDDAPPPTLLHTESGVGAAVTPLGESHDEDSPEAHGYTSNPTEALDAGETVPSDEVETFATSQQAATRFAREQVHTLARRRARSLGARTREELLRAIAHGVDVGEAMDAIEEQLAALAEQAREAA